MKINNVGFNSINVNNKSKDSIAKMPCSECDSVSFSGKVNKKNNSGKIPFRLSSKYQDDFHATSLQLYMRKYLDLKNQGLADEEFLQAFVGNKELSEKEKAEVKITIGVIGKNIEKLDASFEDIIPSMKAATYYRGIFNPSDNKVIDIVKNAKVGDIIQPDSGYPFLSPDYKEAEVFSKSITGFSSPDTSVLMKINVPKGVPIARDMQFKATLFGHNIVLPRGVKYRVLDNKIENNKNYITLEYLDCATDRGE